MHIPLLCLLSHANGGRRGGFPEIRPKVSGLSTEPQKQISAEMENMSKMTDTKKFRLRLEFNLVTFRQIYQVLHFNF